MKLTSNVGDIVLQTDNRSADFKKPIACKDGVLKFGSVYEIKTPYTNAKFVPLRYRHFSYQSPCDVPGDVVSIYIEGDESILKGQCVRYRSDIILDTGKTIFEIQDEIQDKVLIQAYKIFDIDYKIEILPQYKSYRLPTINDIKNFIKKEIFDEDEWILTSEKGPTGLPIIAYIGILNNGGEVMSYETTVQEAEYYYYIIDNNSIITGDFGNYNKALSDLAEQRRCEKSESDNT